MIYTWSCTVESFALTSAAQSFKVVNISFTSFGPEIRNRPKYLILYENSADK